MLAVVSLQSQAGDLGNGLGFGKRLLLLQQARHLLSNALPVILEPGFRVTHTDDLWLLESRVVPFVGWVGAFTPLLRVLQGISVLDEVPPPAAL